jgi:hypothetical protein
VLGLAATPILIGCANVLTGPLSSVGNVLDVAVGALLTDAGSTDAVPVAAGGKFGAAIGVCSGIADDTSGLFDSVATAEASLAAVVFAAAAFAAAAFWPST